MAPPDFTLYTYDTNANPGSAKSVDDRKASEEKNGNTSDFTILDGQKVLKTEIKDSSGPWNDEYFWIKNNTGIILSFVITKTRTVPRDPDLLKQEDQILPTFRFTK